MLEFGGNRRLWGNNHEITAVEYDDKIAQIYKDNFPKDNVIIADAHKYLLEHFREFDFIWSSPPCPTHSRIRKMCAIKTKKDGTTYEQNKPVYPDMTLYQEIIFLQNYYKGFYCVENVIPYYEPLINAQKLGRHLFWTNLDLNNKKINSKGSFDTINGLIERTGFELNKYPGVDKRKLLRNCTESELGQYILNLIENKEER